MGHLYVLGVLLALWQVCKLILLFAKLNDLCFSSEINRAQELATLSIGDSCGYGLARLATATACSDTVTTEAAVLIVTITINISHAFYVDLDIY